MRSSALCLFVLGLADGADAELVEDLDVAVVVFALQVLEQRPSLLHKVEEAAPEMG